MQFPLFLLGASILAGIAGIPAARASSTAPIGTTTAATLITKGAPPSRPERILEVGTDDA